MKTSVFLSYPKPFNGLQKTFIDALIAHMRMNGLEPRTLGITDYDFDVPLRAIRRLMLESCGIITVAFRRTYIQQGSYRPGAANEFALDGKWLTSPYSQIEPAMAFQIGLPTLILREEGVVPEGLLEKGVTGQYMPEFDLAKPAASYLESEEWMHIFKRWEKYVTNVRDRRGDPPTMY